MSKPDLRIIKGGAERVDSVAERRLHIVDAAMGGLHVAFSRHPGPQAVNQDKLPPMLAQIVPFPTEATETVKSTAPEPYGPQHVAPVIPLSRTVEQTTATPETPAALPHQGNVLVMNTMVAPHPRLTPPIEGNRAA